MVNNIKLTSFFGGHFCSKQKCLLRLQENNIDTNKITSPFIINKPIRTKPSTTIFDDRMFFWIHSNPLNSTIMVGMYSSAENGLTKSWLYVFLLTRNLIVTHAVKTSSHNHGSAENEIFQDEFTLGTCFHWTMMGEWWKGTDWKKPGSLTAQKPLKIGQPQKGDLIFQLVWFSEVPGTPSKIRTWQWKHTSNHQ